MKIFADSCAQQAPKPGLAIIVLLLGCAPVYPQGCDITTLIGGTFGGTVLPFPALENRLRNLGWT